MCIRDRLIIDTGTLGNPATGDTLRTAMTKANDNFAELYTDLAETTSSNGILTTGTTNGDVKIFPNGTGIVEIDRLSLNNTTISSLDTNADINILPGGTGGVVLGGQVTAGEIVTNQITSNGSNADLSIQPSGTGDVLISALRINGTTLDSSDSTKVTIAEALDVTGAVTANAGVVVDNITIDGTEIDLSSGDLTLDVAGDILLDAGGNDVKIVNGGTELTRFTNNSQNLILKNPNQNKDITISGNDGGSNVDALVFDMSNSGAALFGAAAYNAEATLTDASTISWNAITQPVAKVTLGGNRTLEAPSNAVAHGGVYMNPTGKKRDIGTLKRKLQDSDDNNN